VQPPLDSQWGHLEGDRIDNMAKCLVTGYKGYIGSGLYDKLLQMGHEVTGIDIKDGQEYDISKGMGELENYNFDFIFHLACIPRVAYSVEEPVLTMSNNVLATSVVLDFARRKGVKRFIYSGSSSVVGNGDGPASPYALQKLTSEIETTLYSKLYRVDTVTLRYFNVYSPDQKADGPYATAVANWMRHIREGEAPFITGGGEQRRDMAHREDVIAANVFAMQYDGFFGGEKLDVGTGENISLNEMKVIVNKYFPKVEFKYVSPRPGDVLYTKACMTPLRRLGWEPKIRVRDGIEDCFKKLKEELS
jgi:nucleoside-diphosphate-sugar epimerase